MAKAARVFLAKYLLQRAHKYIGCIWNGGDVDRDEYHCFQWRRAQTVPLFIDNAAEINALITNFGSSDVGVSPSSSFSFEDATGLVGLERPERGPSLQAADDGLQGGGLQALS
jgi:hypothetical protein